MKVKSLWFLILTALGTSASAKDRPNVLLLCIDDLRPELACFGVGYIHSPHIDSLAEEGRVFQRHYAPSPTSCV